mmetsp:Transcript_15441/g.24208  ORF Transcript_15441/g.24208 Transcript_15441/m.24208 type:complete len:152 (-) Transcript_15441:1055-1510(-)
MTETGTTQGASPTMGVMQGGTTGTALTLSMEGMTEGTVETIALQEMVIGTTTADAADPVVAAEATIAEVGAEVEAPDTGGDEAAAIPAMDTDLVAMMTAGGLLVIRGEVPLTAIRTIPRFNPQRLMFRTPPCHTCFAPPRHLLHHPRVLRT